METVYNLKEKKTIKTNMRDGLTFVFVYETNDIKRSKPYRLKQHFCIFFANCTLAYDILSSKYIPFMKTPQLRQNVRLKQAKTEKKKKVVKTHHQISS